MPVGAGCCICTQGFCSSQPRRIIRIKHSSGYLGVAALTPLVFTIPLGSILAARFFHHDRRTIPALLVSVVLQAMAVTAVLSGVMDIFDRAAR